MTRGFPPPRPAAAALAFLLTVTAAARADVQGIAPRDALPSAAMMPAGYPELEAAARLARDGKPDEAFKGLTDAVARHPELPPARYLMALLAFSVRDNARGVALLEQAAAENPDQPEVYAAFGKLALAEGRAAFARLAFEKARALKTPNGWSVSRRQTLEVTVDDGLALLAEARQDWPAARDELTALLDREPNDGAARHRLGRALFRLGKVDEALEQLRRGSRDDPKLEPAAVALGRLYAQDRKSEQATRWLESALTSDPEDPRVRLALASWMMEQGRADEAERYVREAAGLGAEPHQLRRLRGLVARQAGRFTDAEADFQALAQESPGDFFATNQLALVLAEQDDPAKRRRALELAQVNARAYTGEPEALATLGRALFRLDRRDEAEQVLRAAAARGPVGSDTAYFLALALDARGRTDDARTLVRTAVDTPGPFFARRAARAWLDAHPAKP